MLPHRAHQKGVALVRIGGVQPFVVRDVFAKATAAMDLVIEECLEYIIRREGSHPCDSLLPVAKERGKVIVLKFDAKQVSEFHNQSVAIVGTKVLVRKVQYLTPC